MKYRTKKNLKYQFNDDTKEKIWYRDGQQCIFCRIGYHIECNDPWLYEMKDIMHYINKSQGGLGIEQNGAVGCRYHHGLLDNGNKGLREEMLEIFKRHLMQQYPEWNEEKLIYNKWDFLNLG